MYEHDCSACDSLSLCIWDGLGLFVQISLWQWEGRFEHISAWKGTGGGRTSVTTECIVRPDPAGSFVCVAEYVHL